MATTSSSSASERHGMGDLTTATEDRASSDVTTMAVPFTAGDVGGPSNLDVILEQVTKLRMLAVYLNAQSLPTAPEE